jgi:5,10-methenyltetrahydrofolate synthetase
MAQNNKDSHKVSREEIFSHLKEKEAVVSYVSVRNELDPETYFPFITNRKTFVVPPDQYADPFAEAMEASALLRETSVCIFIPGREFDATGTRHGKGAGWYDRFLSATPKEWLRVGLCWKSQFSDTPLVRESWDEPMDFVCVVSEDSNKAEYDKYRILETHARF